VEVQVSKTSVSAFKSDVFKKCFKDLFMASDGKTGPLTYILREHPLAVGKGGSSFENESDMSYFVHVLNAAVIGGSMLERYLMANNKELDALENQIRLFFSGMVLHDINKLFTPNNSQKAWRLDEVFDDHIPEVLKITGTYMEKIGEPKTWLNDLKYLILITENRTSELVNRIQTSLGRQELEEIGKYLKLGDQVSSGPKLDDPKGTSLEQNIDDNFSSRTYSFSFDIYTHVKSKLTSFISTRDDLSWGINLQFVKFPDVPQTLLRQKIIDGIADKLIISGRRIFIRTPDSIIFEGEPIDNNFIKELSESNQITRIFRAPPEDYDKRLKSFQPTNNKIPLQWAETVDSVPRALKTYVNMFYPKIMLWSKPEWREAHRDFPAKALNKWGIEVELIKDKKDESKFKLEIKRFEDSADDPDIAYKETLAKTAAAKRILLDIEYEEGDEDIAKDIGDLTDNADTIQKKTLIAMAFAGRLKEKSKEELDKEYEKLLEELSDKISEKYPYKENNVISTIQYFLGNGLPDTDEKLLDIPDKKGMCIQCGRASVNDLVEVNSFGFKATSGGKRKLSRLKDDRRYKGKICDLCLLENQVRRDEFRNIANSMEKAGLAVQIFLGDFVTPADLSQIVQAMSDEAKKQFDDDMNIKLSEREKIQLNHHALGFLAKPSDVKGQFFLLKKLLELVQRTGFKVHVTPLFNSERILKPFFTWENAPGWVSELHWNYIRIDKVDGILSELRYILTVANMARGADDIPAVIGARVRGPGDVILKMWEYRNKGKKKIQKNKPKSFSLNEKEALDYYVELLNMKEMESIVDAACKVVYKPPETNNDDRWMIDIAFEVYERGVAEKTDSMDIIKRIAGRLREKALRDPGNNPKAVETGVQEFAESFVEMIKNNYGGRVPRSESRRDIVAEFSLLYHIKKWDSIKKGSE